MAERGPNTTYAANRSSCKASEDNESLKCSRPKKPAPPCEVPAMLQKVLSSILLV